MSPHPCTPRLPPVRMKPPYIPPPPGALRRVRLISSFVRRDSAKAFRLIAALAGQGVVVIGWWLEDRSRDGLLPSDEVPEEVAVAHIAFLKTVHRPGPGAGDRAAKLLAVNGYTCERYGAYLARTIGSDLNVMAASFGDEPIDTDSDEGFEQADEVATVVEQAIGSGEVPPALRRVLNAMLDHIASQVPETDDDGDNYGTGEQLVHSVFTNVAHAVVGTGAYDLSLLAGAPDIHADKMPPAMASAFANIEGLAPLAKRLITEVPVCFMVAAAQLGYQVLSALPFGNDKDSALMAADMAPMFLATILQAGRDPLAAALLTEIFGPPPGLAGT
jgi:hypothetical protein